MGRTCNGTLDGRRRDKAATAVELLVGCDRATAYNAVDHGPHAVFSPHAAAIVGEVIDAYRTRAATAVAVAHLLRALNVPGVDVDDNEDGQCVRYVDKPTGAEVVVGEYDWSYVLVLPDSPTASPYEVDTNLPADCTNPLRIARTLVDQPVDPTPVTADNWWPNGRCDSCGAGRDVAGNCADATCGASPYDGTCDVCAGGFYVDAAGVATHGDTDGMDGHDLDADHVPYMIG